MIRDGHDRRHPTVVEVGRPWLVALVGPAGSGKSTLAARLFAPDDILSSDALRAAVSGDEADQSATRTAFAILHRELRRRLTAGRLVAVDATSLGPAARRSLLDLAARAGAPATAIVIDLPADLVHARNAARTGRRVAPEVVDRHLARLAHLVGPGPDAAVTALRAEGFAAAHVVRSDDELAGLRIVSRR